MSKIIRSGLDWIGRFTALQALIQFLQSWFWPMIAGLVATISGLLQGAPIMWALMAGAITFAAITVGMLAMMALQIQNSPQNKLLSKVIIHHDLTPCEAPLIGNRQQRRASQSRQMLSKSQIVPNVNRTLDKGQLGVELTNNSFFPISVFLEKSETEIEGETPPRSVFPKPPTIIGPSQSLRVLDDAILMEQFPCQHLVGKIDMLIKYGKPSAEKYEIHIKGAAKIQMESNGFVSGIIVDVSGGGITGN